MSTNGKKERRKPEGTRARELVDSLLERLQELEQQRATDRTELHELAALLGRLEAAYERLEDTELLPGTTYAERQTAGGFPGECVRCGHHESTHTHRPLLRCPVPAELTPEGI